MNTKFLGLTLLAAALLTGAVVGTAYYQSDPIWGSVPTPGSNSTLGSSSTPDGSSSVDCSNPSSGSRLQQILRDLDCQKTGSAAAVIATLNKEEALSLFGDWVCPGNPGLVTRGAIVAFDGTGTWTLYTQRGSKFQFREQSSVWAAVGDDASSHLSSWRRNDSC